MKNEILQNLETKWLGKNILYYKTIDSTNEEAKRLATYTPNGTVVIAEQQTNGKGRLGKHWESTSGSPISFSIILHSTLPVKDLSKITLIAGYSVSKAISKTTNLNAQIKWPNDILINNKKVCGILTETCLNDSKNNIIILGIGINVNNNNFSNDELKNKATSLKIESKKNINRIEVLQSLLYEIEDNYEKYLLNDDFNSFITKYKKKCITLGKNITIALYNYQYHAIAKDISPNGELIVLKQNGQLETIYAGEVSISGIAKK